MFQLLLNNMYCVAVVNCYVSKTDRGQESQALSLAVHSTMASDASRVTAWHVAEKNEGLAKTEFSIDCQHNKS